MRRLRRLALALLPLLAARPLAAQGAAPQPATSPDWSALRDETVRLLSDYLRVNTTNPPGNELQAARFLKAILDREGIEAQILDTAELKPGGRANLYARLRATRPSGKKAVALVHHMDVVPADTRYWTVDPFAGLVKDGYVWGRGALDMKGHGMVQLMAMVALSLLPVGLAQTWASVETGYWYARSPEFIQSPVLQVFRWMRAPGDILFTAGIVALVIFVVGLAFGYSYEKRKSLVVSRLPA